jgi:hypothetical protein
MRVIFAGLKIELDHAHIARQLAARAIVLVFELGIIAEHALADRLEQSSFQLAVCARTLQA